MACVHAGATDLRPPGPTQDVYREDCTQCFDSIDDEAGLNVCLHCFNGGCAGDRNHGLLHFQRYGHALALNIRRTPKKRDEPPQKVSKLAIAAETDEDRYNVATSVICYACPSENVDKNTGNIPVVIDGVMNAMSFTKREEVKAWEQEFVPCEHTLCLVQADMGDAGTKDLNQCSACDLKENLWICLECGNIACGRTQHGGARGNSHALAHADSTSHAVAVKLGSISAEGTADIYCYRCNEERTDPELANHLAHWGIHLAGRTKTEKSLMEMQVEHNMQWEFSMTSEDGRELLPIYGPGLTGLANLGNSCYLSSVMQCIFSTPAFQSRYYDPNGQSPHCQTPAQDLETQMRKLADGLLSGRYSRPDSRVAMSMASSEASSPIHQKGLLPAMFKHLIGQGHPEFKTMRQQDAFEFLLHLFKNVSLSKHLDGRANPVEKFRFQVEQRLQCLVCEKVRYKVDVQDNISIAVPARRIAEVEGKFEAVQFSECLDIFTAKEVVELTCPACQSAAGFSKQTKFKTLPQELAVNARRFELVNWVPTKLDIPVIVSDDPIDMASYLAGKHDPNEELLPEVQEVVSFSPNSEALNQLLAMGFPVTRCEKALHATGNSDAEAAMTWLFSHMEDSDIDEPMVLDQKSGSHRSAGQDESKIAQLGEMGIEPSRAQKALAATNGDVERAVDWVFTHPDDGDEAIGNDGNAEVAQTSEPVGYGTVPARYQLRSIVCHKGTSVHAGHYVAFIRKTRASGQSPSWVLFNDEKVVECDKVDDMKQTAYLYFLTRV
ncbi:Ubiquitin carboxyl-terminal hydrolase 14 [Penicillium diatomitis]|uniref:Ubiquitin carboxyl-terminal hydrolase n=1 Tax=Penicillium diatomitis TaxID=2819901 RepID=A0A9W9WT58_9EURO|nr:Ubiquitin carboxyl-terminal hydrolase 14 [Penicillium diatomitis]KAJ5475056.1 Ubiquitin carboxyl-terminal hydrolase 14 [Penicillium diatomitis]